MSEGYFSSIANIKAGLLGSILPNILSASMIIGCLGAILYVSYRIWRCLANAEPVELFPLLRPLVIGFFISTFPQTVLPFLDGTVGIVDSAIKQSVKSGNKEMGQMAGDQVAKVEKDVTDAAEAAKEDAKEFVENPTQTIADKLTNAAKKVFEWCVGIVGNVNQIFDLLSQIAQGYIQSSSFIFQAICLLICDVISAGAKLILRTLSAFSLTILALLGPLAFAASIFDGFASSLTSWISKYISYSLWGPIITLLDSMLTQVEKQFLGIQIAFANDVTQADPGSTWLCVLFAVLTLICMAKVPTMANWVVEGGSSGIAGAATAIGSFAAGSAAKGLGMGAGRFVGGAGASAGSGAAAGAAAGSVVPVVGTVAGAVAGAAKSAAEGVSDAMAQAPRKRKR